MKKIICSSFAILLFSSCANKKKEDVLFKNDSEKVISIADYLSKENALTNKTLLSWTNYYKEFLDKDFDVKNFSLDNQTPIAKTKGTIYGTFDKEFDKIYAPFLIYSPNKKQYLDIDSNYWFIDNIEMKTVSYEVDQQINLVNIESKEIERIGFRGTTQWVEDAFWINDSTIIFLEDTSSEFKPIINLIDLSKNTIKTFIYNKNLKQTSGYSEERLRMKGLNVLGD
jgi:hypothetical protein